MFTHVINAKLLEGYKVAVRFSDGREGVADLADALHGPIFEPLKKGEAFRQLRVDDELRTIVWPNGADLAPEYIYYQAFRDDPDLQAIFRNWGYVP